MTKQRKKRKSSPEWLRQLKFNAAILAASAFVWLLRMTCRIEIVAGKENVDAALARGVVISCTWHQQITSSGLFVRSLVPRGIKAGFLTSPSRDGEFTTRIARQHGAHVMRGSSSRTGGEALKAMIEGTRQGISPMIYPDGPRGPAGVFQPGVAILSQRTGTPVMPVGTAASRYWQFDAWDQNRVPKPFARITIAAGDFLTVDHHDRIDETSRQLGRKIDDLTRVAEASQKR